MGGWVGGCVSPLVLQHNTYNQCCSHKLGGAFANAFREGQRKTERERKKNNKNINRTRF